MAGHCEDCTGCCTVFSVEEIGKAFGEPCRHLAKTLFGVGCGIYNDRPDVCRHYVCLWLDSQRRLEVERMPEALRPDVCKVVMGWPAARDREALYIYPYPGHETAWQRPPVSDHLRGVLARGGKIVVVMGSRRVVIKGDLAFVGTEEEFATLL